MGRHSSAMCVTIDNDHSQPRTRIASHPNHHDRRNHISMMEDMHKKMVQPTSRHHRSYSDVSDFAATPSRTFTEFHTSNGDMGPKPTYSEGTRPAFSEPRPTISEGTMNALAFYNYESLQAAANFRGDPRRRSDLDHRDYIRRSLPSSKRALKVRQVHSDYTQHSSSPDLRDALFTNFSECHKANYSDQIFKGEVESRNLPRSTSIYERGLESSRLLHWKDGLRSSTSPPCKSTKEAKGHCTKLPNKPSGTTRMISHHSSPEKRVELKSRDRGRSLSKDYAFVTMSPKKHFREVLGEESPGATNFRDSLRPFITGPIVPTRKSFASRLTNTREQNMESRDMSVNVIARLMGLEETMSSTQQTSSKASSKVVHDAKSRGEKFFRGLVQFDPQTMRALSPPPPVPSCQSKKHYLGQCYWQESNGLQEDQYQENYTTQYKMEQRLCCCEEDRDYEHLNISRRPLHSFENDYKEAPKQLGYHKDDLPPKLADVHQADDAKHDAQVEILPSLKKQPNQKKKTLWKILEAMRPKVLRKNSRHKQAEPEMLRLTENSIKPIQEMQQQTTRVSFGLKLSSGADKDEPSKYKNFNKQVQEHEQQTISNNNIESSIIKPCIDETTVVVVKPVDRMILSNARSQLSIVDTFQVRQVETTSGNSNNNKKCPSRRASQINNEDCNLAHDQRKPIKSRVAIETTPQSATAEGILESDYETNPSSMTQHDKSSTICESRKTTTPIKKPNPRSRSPTPEIQRKQGQATFLEARPTLLKSLPSKDQIRGAGTIGWKAQLANGKKDVRPLPAIPKAQLAKEEILKRRVNESSATSRLRSSNLENESVEKFVGKETFSTKAPGARIRSSSVVKLKQPKKGIELLGAPPKKEDGNCPTTADPITPHKSSSSDLDVQIQLASVQVQLSDSEYAMEHLKAVQGPNLGSSKEPLVRQLPEVQKLERVCIDDSTTAQLSNFETCGAILDEPQLLLQIQEAEIEPNEELTTPRGVRLNFEKLDDKIVESMDRPSPISVLETTCFDEDLPLSPTSSSKLNVMPIQDANSVSTSNEEEHESCVKDLETSQDTSFATTEAIQNLDVLFNTCDEELQAQVENHTETEISINNFQSYFEDVVKTSEESCSSLQISTLDESYDNTMLSSSVSDKFTKQQSSVETINENLLQSLRSNGMFQEDDYLVLLDCLEEIMERILDSQSDLRLWVGLPNETIYEIPKGKQLERELLIEMQNMKRSSLGCQDICESVHNLLLKDLFRCQGRQWSTFNADREIIGLDMETMIVGDLIEEAVGDLCALQCHKFEDFLKLETTRRQLFMN